MPVKFQNIIGPAFLATYLVNKDVTGITQYEKDAADTFLKDAEIVNVVGAKALVNLRLYRDNERGTSFKLIVKRVPVSS